VHDLVDAAYRDNAPYALTGTAKKVLIDLKPEPMDTENAVHQAANHAPAAAPMSC
jgi:arylsulfatase